MHFEYICSVMDIFYIQKYQVSDMGQLQIKLLKYCIENYDINVIIMIYNTEISSIQTAQTINQDT